jgi:hypothetical protein
MLESMPFTCTQDFQLFKSLMEVFPDIVKAVKALKSMVVAIGVKLMRTHRCNFGDKNLHKM